MPRLDLHKIVPTPVEMNVDVRHNLKDGLGARPGLPQFLLCPFPFPIVSDHYLDGRRTLPDNGIASASMSTEEPSSETRTLSIGELAVPVR